MAKSLYKLSRELVGHSGDVRDLPVPSDGSILSASRDKTLTRPREAVMNVIKHWTAVTGDYLRNLYGHTSYICSLSAISGGSLVALSGEDITVRLWSNGEINQTITLLTQTVWSVRILPNEDIICGASDSFVRIFTANPERYADSEILQRFEESIANTELNAKTELGYFKMSYLADQSALQRTGKKDEETKLIKEAGGVKAYSWSQKELKWISSH
ncbi:hypothetical protein TSAR_011567 [Trichomalopsis sarcophagae]|uniref:Uncharacterized protein n=1 Tax=Trichomalopsis sarcophagae TaxID=543379 RepID=A0A232ESF9_9HYME|nr:hypothetical protein TSAR_011567 [Trichomalopsis sarcophagae]